MVLCRSRGARSPLHTEPPAVVVTAAAALVLIQTPRAPSLLPEASFTLLSCAAEAPSVHRHTEGQTHRSRWRWSCKAAE